MKYRLRSSGEIKSQGEIRRLNPNMSIPRVWKEATYEALQIDPILSSPRPEITDLQNTYVDGATQDGLGNWVEQWVIVDKFSDIVDENGVVVKTKAEQEVEFEQSKLKEQKASVVAEIDTFILEKIKAFGYDTTDSIAKYLVAENPFYEECKALSVWIGSIWAYLYSVEADVVAGTRTFPTTEELKAELPVLSITP